MPKARTFYVIRVTSVYGDEVEVHSSKKMASFNEDYGNTNGPSELEAFCYEGWLRVTGIKLNFEEPTAIHVTRGKVRK